MMYLLIRKYIATLSNITSRLLDLNWSEKPRSYIQTQLDAGANRDSVVLTLESWKKYYFLCFSQCSRLLHSRCDQHLLICEQARERTVSVVRSVSEGTHRWLHSYAMVQCWHAPKSIRHHSTTGSWTRISDHMWITSLRMWTLDPGFPTCGQRVTCWPDWQIIHPSQRGPRR